MKFRVYHYESYPHTRERTVLDGKIMSQSELKAYVGSLFWTADEGKHGGDGQSVTLRSRYQTAGGDYAFKRDEVNWESENV